MRVKLYSMLRSKVGVSLIDVATPPGATVRHVLDDLTARYPTLKQAIWDETEHSLVSFVHVLVNGRDVRYLKGLDTPVGPEDAMDIFPPVGGGTTNVE